MPGALMQLVAVGAQNELVNGSPSMTHFRSVFRRHTNFAMEHIRMTFSSSNLQFDTFGTRTLSCRVDRYANVLHDCYLNLTLPDIWSPMVPIPAGSSPPTGYSTPCTALGYEFQWIPNIGYNMIDHIELVMNGTVIQRLNGEWLKMYSYFTHDQNKRQIVDQMVGNVTEMYDPSHAYDRNGQYPHAITYPNPVYDANQKIILPGSTIPEPSIRSRQLVVPLHFWFCENVGSALPLISLQNSEVYINVVLQPLTHLYTIVDVSPTSPTYGQRIRPTGTYPMTTFLSPPTVSGTPSSAISTFFPDPYIEANFIYLEELEKNQLAVTDQTFMFKEVRFVGNEGQFGPNTDIEIPMFNLVTRIAFSAMRSDNIATNQWDNYTNWQNPNRAPWSINTTGTGSLYNTGQLQVTSVYPRNTMTNALLLFDGNERFATKPIEFFSMLQTYKHSTGASPDQMPGIFMYSFALNNDEYQPSGAANGSKINKAILRLALQQPLPAPSQSGAGTTTVVTVLKSTVFSQNPTVIPQALCSLYTDDQLVKVVRNADGNIVFSYTYTLRVYVESYNFLRIVSGLANLVFAS